MLKIFRTNQLLLTVLLIGYAAFLRVAYFQVPLIKLPTEPGIGNSWMAPFINEPSVLCFSIIIGLLFIQAFIANKIFFGHRLHRDLSLYGGVFIILTGSLLPDFLNYSSFLFANVFLLLALAELLKIYRISSVADIIFNTGFFIGLAALFQPVYLVFLIAIGIAIVNLKSGKFRDQFILMLGAIIPLFLIGVVYFLKDQFSLFWNQQWASAFSIPQISEWKNIFTPSFGIMASLLLLVVLQYRKILAKTKMELQIKLNTIYWFLGGAVAAMLISPSWHTYRWQITVPIIGLLLGIYFTKAKPAIAEAFHLGLIILLFVLHFSGGLGFLIS